MWTDANSDGRTDAGELHSLSQMGIVELHLDAQPTVVVQNGNLVGLMGSYTTVDGVRHELADVWLRTGDATDRSFDLSTLQRTHDNEGALARIDLSGNGGGGDTLKVAAGDVLAFGSTEIGGVGGSAAQQRQMLVKGDATDTVVIDNSDGGWSRNGTAIVDGTSFAVYTHGQAQLLVDEKVHVLM